MIERYERLIGYIDAIKFGPNDELTYYLNKCGNQGLIEISQLTEQPIEQGIGVGHFVMIEYKPGVFIYCWE